MSFIKIDVRKLKHVIAEIASDAAGERNDNCIECGVAIGKIGDVQVQVICSAKGGIRFPLRFPLRARYRCLEFPVKKARKS